MFGLMAYPAQGIYKSIKAAKGRNATVIKFKHLVMQSHGASGGAQLDSTRVCADFEERCQIIKDSVKK